jgi:hypothetical protein
MHLMRNSIIFLIFGLFWAGCATSLPFFTESYRAKVGEQDIHTLQYHIATTVDFKSLRELDPVVEKGPFAKSGHRFLQITDTTPGRLLGKGNGWLSIDFGQGIVLTFNRRALDGVYVMSGWGTISIAGERFDIIVGVLSGSDLELHIGV